LADTEYGQYGFDVHLFILSTYVLVMKNVHGTLSVKQPMCWEVMWIF